MESTTESFEYDSVEHDDEEVYADLYDHYVIVCDVVTVKQVIIHPGQEWPASDGSVMASFPDPASPDGPQCAYIMHFFSKPIAASVIDGTHPTRELKWPGATARRATRDDLVAFLNTNPSTIYPESHDAPELVLDQSASHGIILCAASHRFLEIILEENRQRDKRIKDLRAVEDLMREILDDFSEDRFSMRRGVGEIKLEAGRQIVKQIERMVQYLQTREKKAIPVTPVDYVVTPAQDGLFTFSAAVADNPPLRGRKRSLPADHNGEGVSKTRASEARKRPRKSV